MDGQSRAHARGFPATFLMAPPTLLVLDFDGVICNGLEEYFQSSKRVYQQIWHDASAGQLDRQRENFFRFRPVIETGWEMPLLLRALSLNCGHDHIENDWFSLCQKLQSQENISKVQLAPALDQVRDDYIQNHLDEWLGLHHFYPGVIKQLSHWLESQSPHWLYILSTKEGRFVQQLLQAEKIPFPLGQIIGKEIHQPKAPTLEQLLHTKQLSPAELWFVEDRFKTLATIANQPTFDQTKLFLADWGYNTPSTRALVKAQQRIQLLSLQQFAAPFGQWDGLERNR